MQRDHVGLQQSRLRRAASTGMLAVAMTLSGVACSSSSEDSPAVSPEEHQAPASEVTAGLHSIETIAADVASQAGTDKKKAVTTDEGIEPVWAKVEGTVKTNDQDAYISFEDSFATLKGAAEAGDAAKAKAASEEVAKTVADYLAKYPG